MRELVKIIFEDVIFDNENTEIVDYVGTGW
jgi:hypothetical protein